MTIVHSIVIGVGEEVIIVGCKGIRGHTLLAVYAEVKDR